MKYFIYSRTQHKEQDKIADKISRKYTPGRVNTKGTWKPFTEILDSPNSRYSDASIIASSESNTLEDMNYTDPQIGTR